MELFKHQAIAVDWLVENWRAGTQHGLFDEQGLGKTAVAIVARERIGAQTMLVVCPTSVLHNWSREVAMWAPHRRVQVLESQRDVLRTDADTVVVTHGLMWRARIFRQLTTRRWSLVVLDEAQAMKNHTAKRTRAFYGLGPQLNAPSIRGVADRLLPMTGTPMPNNPSELWTMLRGTAPERTRGGGVGPLSWWSFRERYCRVVPSEYDPKGRVVGVRNGAELRERLRGYALRRLLTDELDLPPMTWGTVGLRAIDMDALHELQQLELPTSSGDGKPDLETFRQGLEFSTWRRLCGQLKAAPAVELLQEELAEGTHKLVVFAHHKAVVDTLIAGLARFGAVRITGEVTGRHRQTAIDAFQRDAGVRVAVCNIVAAGTGITLTAARHVVFVEQSFVPAEMMQAASRVHRIGQSGSVSVRVLSLADSIDELCGMILARKAQMIREVLA